MKERSNTFPAKSRSGRLRNKFLQHLHSEIPFVPPGEKHQITWKFIQDVDPDALKRVLYANWDHLGYLFPPKTGNPFLDLMTVDRGISKQCKSKSPELHLVFFLGDDIVGQGSLLPSHREHLQVSIWVDQRRVRKGLGNWILWELENLAFTRLKVEELLFQHHEENVAAMLLALTNGYEFREKLMLKVSSHDTDLVWHSWAYKPPLRFSP